MIFKIESVTAKQTITFYTGTEKRLLLQVEDGINEILVELSFEELEKAIKHIKIDLND